MFGALQSRCDDIHVPMIISQVWFAFPWSLCLPWVTNQSNNVQRHQVFKSVSVLLANTSTPNHVPSKSYMNKSFISVFAELGYRIFSWPIFQPNNALPTSKKAFGLRRADVIYSKVYFLDFFAGIQTAWPILMMRFNQWLWMLMRNWWSGPGSKIMQKYCFLVELELIVKAECVGRQGLLKLCVHLDYGYHIVSKELSSLFIKFASVIVSEICWSGYAQLKRIMLWCRYAVHATRAVWIMRFGGVRDHPDT